MPSQMPSGPLVTLLTDFGVSDGYVAAMKGAILTVCPGATLVDISHNVPAHNVRHAAFVLGTTFPFFPAGTVHVCVIDPGVGGARRAIAVQAAGQRFVAPDNGLLTAVLALGHYQAVELVEARFWRTATPSATFHGRDIFAPVGAHLAAGATLMDVGAPVENLQRLDSPAPIRCSDGRLLGHIAHIDRFGNAITDIPATWLGSDGEMACKVGGAIVPVSSLSYVSVPRGSLLALVGSHGFLEIAVREGSAEGTLGVRVGAPVTVWTKKPGASEF